MTRRFGRSAGFSFGIAVSFRGARVNGCLGWGADGRLSDAGKAKPTLAADQFGFAMGNNAHRKLSTTSFFADHSQM